MSLVVKKKKDVFEDQFDSDSDSDSEFEFENEQDTGSDDDSDFDYGQDSDTDEEVSDAESCSSRMSTFSILSVKTVNINQLEEEDISD